MDGCLVGNEVSVKLRIIVNQTDFYQYRANEIVEVEHSEERLRLGGVAHMSRTVAHLADEMQAAQQFLIVDIFHKLRLGDFVVERFMLHRRQ